ncbi:MAG TPA: cbb3-type cytochrome c oxidase subunit 3 [Gammaproteobacteria bacterium]|nr:cbb3-type cytochrome c oxidase subunit 3 [Gammaproteobacteria bacterium]
MDVSFLLSLWTVIAFAIFVGIVIWAWSGSRKNDFEKAARMALDDEQDVSDEAKRKSAL